MEKTRLGAEKEREVEKHAKESKGKKKKKARYQ